VSAILAATLALSLGAAPLELPGLRLRLIPSAQLAQTVDLGGPAGEQAAYGIAGLGGGAFMGVAAGLFFTRGAADDTVQLGALAGGVIGAALGGALGAVAASGDALAKNTIWQLCLLDCGVTAAAVVMLFLASLGPPFGGA
jgi:hypothetical protein